MVKQSFPELKLGYEKRYHNQEESYSSTPFPERKLRNISLKKPLKHNRHLEPHNEKTNSNILNFHRSTSSACCQVAKNVAVAL